MSFHDVRFPDDISYGSAGGPSFRTQIIQLDSGAESRIARWVNPRRLYNAGYGVKTLDQMGTVMEFFIARQGSAYSFRFKDYMDFTSASDHRSSPVETDEEIGVGDGSNDEFQLAKTYTSGGVTRTRQITKPVSGTVKVAVAGALKTETTHYTVNYTTGVVTFTGGNIPTMGQSVTAGFEFDVPVRFALGSDEVLSASIDSFDSGSMVLNLIEVLEEGEFSEEFFYGGAREILTAANLNLTVSEGRVQAIQTTVSDVKVFLPNPTSVPHGGPIFFILNIGVNSFLLRKHDDSAIVTVASGGMVIVCLSVDNASNPVWFVA